jgi:preprotein translocase subunit SecA
MDMPDRVTGKSEPGVVIVDTNTGRPMIGRQWSDGLHQAVECKEGVPIKPETQTVASVTIQNFFKMYKRLAGMTGTADTEAQEFYDIYKLDVVSIPTNRDVVRRDFDDLMYLRGKDKWDGIVDEIKAFHDVGRPILVGTTSVEKSETLSRMLTGKHQIKHAVLNAKQHEREAQIITGAGHLGAVMIATNMAGRGTDIKLTGVSRQELLEHWLRRGIASRGLTVESSDEQLRENVFRKVAASELRDESLRKDEIEKMDFSELELRLLRHWAARYTWLTDAQIAKLGRDGLLTELDRTGRIALHRIRWFDSVEDLGGLHVIGTERHESRRIDNQLRGRSGRQGDKGSSRFYVACEDDLMKMFMGETTQKFLARFGLKEGEAIEHPWLSKNVERAQKKVEERNFQIRKNILEYDEVMEHQRQRFYGLRQRVLEGRQLSGLLFEYIEEAVDKAVEDYLDSDYAAQCAAEFAKDRLDASIAPDRLKGKDLEDMTLAIRKLAKDDAVELIRVTIGEYMPTEGSEAAVDFDAAGLSRWAKNRFGVDLDPEQLRSEGGGARTHVQAALEEAAAARIDGADLAGLSEFAEAEYGYRQLSAWAKRKFEIDVSVEELRAAHEREDKTGSARDPIVAKARELAAKREVEYPADHAMQVTMLIARQDAQQGFDYLARWVRQRFGRELTSEQIRSTPPNKMREQLRGWMQEFVDGGGLEKAVAEASAQPTDDALDAYLQKRFNVGITDRMRYLDPAERADAIRARVETIVRAELVQLEQVIFLDVLDHEWKDHLHAMDQLRDTIGFRQFSQQDPRIEYKREGQRQFGSTMERVRERVTDLAFRGRLQPHLPPPAPRPTTPGPTAMPTGAPAAQPGGLTPSAPASPGAIAPARPGPAFGSSISGPGFFMGPSVRPPAPPPGQPGPGQAGQGGPAGTPPTGTPPPPPA